MSEFKEAHPGQPATPRSRRCLWPGCEAKSAVEVCVCEAHWLRLPMELRERVREAYRPGHEAESFASEEYLSVEHDIWEYILHLPSPK